MRRIARFVVVTAALLACQGGAGNGSDGGAEGGTASSGATSTSSSSSSSSSSGATSSSSSSSGGVDDAACTTASDCTWGEIKTDILAKTDCPCLLGCPSLPQNKTVTQRRSMQYQTLCTPGKNGAGQPCPIDDCAEPPPLTCANGKCQVAPTRDGG